MAFNENFIDFVSGLPPVAGRVARPERRQELMIWRILAPELPAGEPPGLARKVIKRELQGLEPPGDAFGVDQAIGLRCGFNYRPGCWPQGCHSGIGPEDMDARDKTRECPGAGAFDTLPWIEELEGGG